MSCNGNCSSHDPCSTHDNCGCVNPSTFDCTTYTGTTLSCLGISSGDSGNDILERLDELACDQGKVLLNGDDTCPEYLMDKIEAGTNISLQITGTGCSRKVTIHSIIGGAPVDVNAKVTVNDTTSGYLDSKILTGTYLTKSVLSPSGNEKLELDVSVASLVSTDVGNLLTTGTDGGLKTSFSAPDGSETKVMAGTAVTVTGSGTVGDPYIVSINPSISPARLCFDGIWRPVTLTGTGNPSVTYLSGAPQYRYRFDGSVEFKGSASYTVNFGAYTLASRKHTVTIGNIPTTCLTGVEQTGTADLKGINYIDVPQAGADQYAQQYGYIIRKTTANILIEFQSSFLNATDKTIVVNFDGAISHPSI